METTEYRLASNESHGGACGELFVAFECRPTLGLGKCSHGTVRSFSANWVRWPDLRWLSRELLLEFDGVDYVLVSWSLS